MKFLVAVSASLLAAASGAPLSPRSEPLVGLLMTGEPPWVLITWTFSHCSALTLFNYLSSDSLRSTWPISTTLDIAGFPNSKRGRQSLSILLKMVCSYITTQTVAERVTKREPGACVVAHSGSGCTGPASGAIGSAGLYAVGTEWEYAKSFKVYRTVQGKC